MCENSEGAGMMSNAAAMPQKEDSEEKGVTNNYMEEIFSMIDKLKKCSEALGETINKTPTTKANIKKSARTVCDLSEALMCRWKEYEVYSRENVSQPAAREKGCDIGIQTQVGKEEVDLEIAIASASDLNEFASLLDKEWPEAVYQTASVRTSKSNIRKEDWDIAAVVNPEDEEGIEIKQVKGLYPEITCLLTEKLEEGKVEYVKTLTNIHTSRGGGEEKSHYGYAIPLRVDKNGINDIEPLYKIILQWKDLLIEHGRERVIITAPVGINMIYVRKLTEWVFRKSDIKICCLVPGTNKAASSRLEENRAQGKKSKTEETIVCKGNGKSYADLVKSLQEGVNLKTLGVKVKSIKKTGKNDMVVKVVGAGAGKALQEKIKCNVENVDVNLTKEKSTLHIYGIVPSVNEEDIKAAISEETNTDKAAVEVTSIRPGRFGNNNATVSVLTGPARAIAKQGTIRIGWMDYTVRERIYVPRCFKCHGFGHLSKQCEQTVDKKEDCLNCGESGHHAKDCGNEARCTVCKEDGHRSDQMKCPVFRKLIMEARARL